MREAEGNLWDFNGIHAITTNGYVKKDGRAVMGRGCAKEAALRYPELASRFGFELIRYGNNVFYLRQFGEHGLITFPVKYNWWERADLDLIKQSAIALMEKVIPYFNLTSDIYLPRPGCGNGNLAWKDVKDLIEDVLSDQVIVVRKGGEI